FKWTDTRENVVYGFSATILPSRKKYNFVPCIFAVRRLFGGALEGLANLLRKFCLRIVQFERPHNPPDFLLTLRDTLRCHTGENSLSRAPFRRPEDRLGARRIGSRAAAEANALIHPPCAHGRHSVIAAMRLQQPVGRFAARCAIQK